MVPAVPALQARTTCMLQPKDRNFSSDVISRTQYPETTRIALGVDEPVCVAVVGAGALGATSLTRHVT